MDQSQSQFNPDLFLQTSYSEQTSTKTEPLPDGEYTALIKTLIPRQVQGKQDASKLYVFLDMELEIPLNGELQSKLGREKSVIRHSIGIDMTESGAIDMAKGKNVQLGRLREAANQNVLGEPWTPAQLVNRLVKAKVGHEPSDKDPTIIYNRVEAVGKA